MAATKRPYPHPVRRFRAEFADVASVTRTLEPVVAHPGAVHVYTSRERIVDERAFQHGDHRTEIDRAAALFQPLSRAALRLSGPVVSLEDKGNIHRFSVLTPDTPTIDRLTKALDQIRTIDNPPLVDYRIVIELAHTALKQGVSINKVPDLLEGPLNDSLLRVAGARLARRELAGYMLTVPPARKLYK